MKHLLSTQQCNILYSKPGSRCSSGALFPHRGRFWTQGPNIRWRFLLHRQHRLPRNQKSGLEPWSTLKIEYIFTDWIIVRGSQGIPLVNEVLCLLYSRFKAETVVKVGNIFVDSLEADTEGNMELSALDLFVKLPCILDGDVTTNQIQLIDSSLLKRVDDLLSSTLGSSQAKVAPSLMVNPFNCTRSEILQLVVIVASPAELNARHLVYFVDLCEQNNQLSDDVVDAWCGSSQTYDVS